MKLGHYRVENSRGVMTELPNSMITAKCPECHGSIFVEIGLPAQSGENTVRCPSCNKHVVALVPGPVIDHYLAPE